MQNFIKLLESIKDRQFRISQTKSGETIQQTDRNALKSELMQALKLDLADAYEFVFQSKSGILVEVANGCIADGITNESGSGAITLAVDISVMSLETNAEVENECWESEQAEKRAKAEQKAKEHADKVAKAKAKKG